jgi:hypothetical protein
MLVYIFVSTITISFLIGLIIYLYINTCDTVFSQKHNITPCCTIAFQNIERQFTDNNDFMQLKNDTISQLQVTYNGRRDLGVVPSFYIQLKSPFFARKNQTPKLLHSGEHYKWTIEQNTTNGVLRIYTNSFNRVLKKNTSIGFDIYPPLPNDTSVKSILTKE